jgi:hypothetical protein
MTMFYFTVCGQFESFFDSFMCFLFRHLTGLTKFLSPCFEFR